MFYGWVKIYDLDTSRVVSYRNVTDAGYYNPLAKLKEIQDKAPLKALSSYLFLVVIVPHETSEVFKSSMSRIDMRRCNLEKQKKGNIVYYPVEGL